MKKNVGILKYMELIIQKQFLNEKKKKNRKVLLVLHGASAGGLTPSLQTLLSSVLRLLHDMPEFHLLIRFQLTTMSQWLSKARFHLASLPGSCCLVEDNS